MQALFYIFSKIFYLSGWKLFWRKRVINGKITINLSFWGAKATKNLCKIPHFVRNDKDFTSITHLYLVSNRSGRNFFQQRRRAVSSYRRYFRKVRLIPYRIVLLFFLSFRYPHIFSWWRHIPTPSMHFLLDKHNYDLSH